MNEKNNMTKQDIIQYASNTDWIEDQAETLYKIALEEYPEQFGSFIKDRAGLESFYIEKGKIYLTFEELTGDWGDKHFFEMDIETFLNEAAFRGEQKAKKIAHDERILAFKKEKEESERARELETLNRLKQKYKDR